MFFFSFRGFKQWLILICDLILSSTTLSQSPSTWWFGNSSLLETGPSHLRSWKQFNMAYHYLTATEYISSVREAKLLSSSRTLSYQKSASAIAHLLLP